jgi:hypothetical protein
MSNARELPPESMDGDSTYLEKTLRHVPTDLLLDDSTGQELVRSQWRRSTKLAFGVFVVFFVLWIATGFSDADDVHDAMLGTGIFITIIVFVVHWLIFLNREKQEAISEWYTLLGGRADAADSVYSHIVGRLRDRKLPIQNHLVTRTLTEFGSLGNRLVLAQDHYYVYITAFSYGTSLYLGWTMWRVRKGSDLLRQNNNPQSNGLDPITRILQLEQLKAMREAVHAVCREALHTAVKEITVPESYGFPAGMPAIENPPYRRAPRPDGGRGWAPPPPRP